MKVEELKSLSEKELIEKERELKMMGIIVAILCLPGIIGLMVIIGLSWDYLEVHLILLLLLGLFYFRIYRARRKLTVEIDRRSS